MATAPATSAPQTQGFTLEQIGQQFKAQNPTNDPIRNNVADWIVGAKYVQNLLSKNPSAQAQVKSALAPGQLERIPSNLDAHIQVLKQALEQQQKTGSPIAPETPIDSPVVSIAKTAAGFPANVAKSGWNFVKGLGTLIAHPIKSAENLGNVAVGAAEAPFGMNTDQTAAFKQAAQKMILDRYGSVDKAANTIYNDPVGFLADLSTVAAGVGSAAKLADVGKLGEAADLGEAGAGSDVSKAGAVAKTANEVSDLTNPVNMAAKGAAKVGSAASKAIGWVGKQAIGKLSGVGMDNVEDFSRIMRSGTPEERAAATDMMRNNDAFRQTYDGIVEAAKQLKANRGENYRSTLATLDHGTSYDVSPLVSKMQSLVEDYTKKPVGSDGTVDFSVSGIKQADRADIQQAVSAVQNRLKMQGGRTLDGLDSLKQDLHNLAQGLSPKAKSFVTQLEKETKNILTNNVKGYAQMETDYAQKSAMLDELVNEFSPSSMKSALGMGGRGAFSTGVKKIISMAKTDDSFKRDILEQLQSQDGVDKNLIAQLSGASFSPYLSEGGIGKMAEGFGLVTAFFNPAELIHLGALFTVTSPRVMGELLNALGYGGKAVDAFRQFMTSPAGKQLQTFIVRGGVTAQRANESQQQ